MDFYAESTGNIEKYGRSLLSDNRGKWQSFEAAANHIVQQVYEDFEDDKGNKLFALVRIFKMVNNTELPPEGLKDIEDSDKWLALMATVGQETAWNSRLESVGHRLIPSGAFETPMLKATFEQLGLKHQDADFTHEAGFMAKYFHVENADGSPFIVAQDEFVKPHKIQSVVGIGSLFSTQSMFVMLGFTKSPLKTVDAERFANLASFVGTLLATYEVSDQAVWQPA